MSFHVGQMVVCVRFIPSDAFDIPGAIPAVGSVYTVGFVTLDFRGIEAIGLVELPGQSDCGLPIGFIASHFRPVKQTSIEIFQQMLVNPPREVVS
jgi:hypothetical protein